MVNELSQLHQHQRVDHTDACDDVIISDARGVVDLDADDASRWERLGGKFRHSWGVKT